MSIFASVFFVLSFSEFCTSTFSTEFQLQKSEHEFEALVSVGRKLKQAASGSIVAEEEMGEEIDCADVLLGADLAFITDEALRNLTSVTMTECCEECQSMEDCTTFRRNRSSGLCELFSFEETSFQINSNSDFDIGGMIGRENVQEASPAASAVPVPNCRIGQGRTFPNGNVLTRGNSRTARRCCEICRASSECNSWYYNDSNNRCTLNRDIPTEVSRDPSRFGGGNTRD